jgi:hypothetical protein
VLDVSPDYQTVLRGPSHSRSTTIEIMSDRSTVLRLVVNLISGSVSVDGTAASRRSFSAVLVDDDRMFGRPGSVTPLGPEDPLLPYGTLARVSQTVGLPSTDPSGWIRVPLGLFRLNNVKPSGDGTVAISGFDFARTISRNKLTAPYLIRSGTNYVDAIVALAQDRLGTALYQGGQIASTDEVTPLITIDSGEDPWSHLSDMALSLGMVVYFDAFGQFCLQPTIPVQDADVVWEYVEGGNMLVDGAVEYDDDPGFNGVVMTAEGSVIVPPLTSVLFDGNPQSPTYYKGPYGRVPDFQSSPTIGSQAQADARARAWLQQSMGVTEQAAITCVPNPAHEAGDVVQVTRTRAGIDGLFALESFELPFMVTDAMSATTAKRRAFMPEVDDGF